MAIYLENIMTLQERYIERQKKCGIEVGDEVKITRPNVTNEGGSVSWWHEQKEIEGDQAVGVVHQINERSIVVDNCNGFLKVPYFVLEIVKKKDGTVPDTINVYGILTDLGECTMKTNKKFYCEVHTETVDKDDNVRNATIVEQYELWAAGDLDAREQVLMDHGTVIKKARAKKNTEVAIICRPFCG